MKKKDVALLLVCAAVVMFSFQESGGWLGSSSTSSFTLVPAFRLPLALSSLSNGVFPLEHERLYA